MQLTLTTTLPRHPRAAVLRPLVPLTPDAAMSQLDQIASSSLNAPPTRDGLGGTAMLMVVVGGFLLVSAAALWQAPAERPAARPAAAALRATPAAPAAVAVAPTASVVVASTATDGVAPAAADVLSPGSATPTAKPVAAAAPLLAIEPAAPAFMPAAPDLSILPPPSPLRLTLAAELPLTLSSGESSGAPADAVRKARARQQAEVKRKAALVASTEETQRLQRASQRREAELAQQAAALESQRVAAEAARQQQLAAQRLASSAPRGVRETCAGSGLIGESLCRARECGRAEHHADALCVRLRDAEEAQRRASFDR